MYRKLSRPAQTVALGCMGLLFIYLIYLYKMALTANTYMAKARRMEMVLLEMKQYNQIHGRLPCVCETDASGNCALSWRVELLFFAGGTPLTWRPDANSPPSVGFGKMKSFSAPLYCDNGSVITSVVGVTGDDAALGSQSRSLEDIDSDTVVVLDAGCGLNHWCFPHEFDLRVLSNATESMRWRDLPEYNMDTMLVGFADGVVWRISTYVPIRVLRPFLTVSGAKAAERDDEVITYRVSLWFVTRNCG